MNCQNVPEIPPIEPTTSSIGTIGEKVNDIFSVAAAVINIKAHALHICLQNTTKFGSAVMNLRIANV